MRDPRTDADRFMQLDGLRAVAALAIFATHVALFTGFTSTSPLGPLVARLNVGVALFFLLSAFLLYRPRVVARYGQSPPPALKRYAIRRAVRVVPAYWAVLLVLGLLAPHLVTGALGERWWVYFGFLQVYFQADILTGVQVAWSLCTEVAFYLLLPVLAAVSARLLAGRPVRQQVRLELLALVVSAGVTFVLRGLPQAPTWIGTYGNTLPGRWPWFAAGLALAVISASPREALPAACGSIADLATRRPWLWWTVGAACLALGAFGRLLPRDVFVMDTAEQQVELVLFAVVAVCLMVPLIFTGSGPARGPARLLATRPAVWLGTVSYGIFLWHYPVITLVVDTLDLHGIVVVSVLSLMITLAIAAASWYGLERPLMRRTTRRSDRPDRGMARTVPALEPAP